MVQNCSYINTICYVQYNMQGMPWRNGEYNCYMSIWILAHLFKHNAGSFPHHDLVSKTTMSLVTCKLFALQYSYSVQWKWYWNHLVREWEYCSVFLVTPMATQESTLMEFHPGNINRHQLSDMFGSLKPTAEPKIQFGISEWYETNLGVFTNLYSCKDGNVLMFDEFDTHSMKKVKLTELRIECTVKTKNINVYDITEIENNECIVSFFDRTSLIRLKPDGKWNIFSIVPHYCRVLFIIRNLVEY